MKFIPGTLLWRTLLVVVSALVLSQVAAIYLLNEFVTQPRARASIGQFVSHLKTISAAIQTMDDKQEAEFIARVAEKEGIRIQLSRNTERMRVASDVATVRVFRDHIREVFGPKAEVYVRAAEDRPAKFFWVRLPSGDKEFWV